MGRIAYRRAFLLLLVAAVAVRLGWALWKMHQGLDMAVTAEAFDEARHVAAGQGLAGAYGDDRLTAHLLPIPPLIAGAVYAVLGVATPAAELTLWAYATVLALVRIALFERCFARLGLGRGARLGAVAILSLASPHLSHEAVTFRSWEGALAGAVEAAFLLLLLRWLDRDEHGRTGWGAPVASGALLFFINPPLGVAAIACLAAAALPRFRTAPVLRMAALGVTVLALMIGPWAWRNQQAVGHPVLLRSNAGLELALSMRPGARASADPRASFAAQLRRLHPRHSAQAYATMRAMGGEVAYSAALGSATRRWMIAHPGEAAMLMARHVVEQLFPPAWVMDTNNGQAIAVGKATVASAAAALGLLGFALALARRRWRWRYPALLVAVPLLLMAPFEPYHRYIFLLFTPLTFAGAGLIDAGWQAWAARRRRHTESSVA